MAKSQRVKQHGSTWMRDCCMWMRGIIELSIAVVVSLPLITIAWLIELSTALIELSIAAFSLLFILIAAILSVTFVPLTMIALMIPPNAALILIQLIMVSFRLYPLFVVLLAPLILMMYNPFYILVVIPLMVALLKPFHVLIIMPLILTLLVHSTMRNVLEPMLVRWAYNKGQILGDMLEQAICKPVKDWIQAQQEKKTTLRKKE